MNQFESLPLCKACQLVEEMLAAAGVESAKAESRLILSEAAGVSLLDAAFSERETGLQVSHRIEEILRRRCAGEPLQYILGRSFFYDLELEVSPAVLIPRPETELLVDRAVKKLPLSGRMLDLGTGSGAIALAAAHARPDISVLAVDISADALACAEKNRSRLKIENVTFRQSDLFSSLKDDDRFDFIAANLPYVPPEDRPHLSCEVICHEPELALFAGNSGMEIMLRAVSGLHRHLNVGGEVCFELDPRQSENISHALEREGFASSVIRDLAGRERFVSGKKL